MTLSSAFVSIQIDCSGSLRIKLITFLVFQRHMIINFMEIQEEGLKGNKYFYYLYIVLELKESLN